MESQGIIKVVTIYPEGDMTVCTQDISLRATNVNLMVALDEKSEDQSYCVYKMLYQSILQMFLWISERFDL